MTYRIAPTVTRHPTMMKTPRHPRTSRWSSRRTSRWVGNSTRQIVSRRLVGRARRRGTRPSWWRCDARTASTRGTTTKTTTSPGGRIGPRTRRCPRSWPRCRAPGSAAPFSNERTTAPSLSRRRRSRRRGSGAISIRCAGQGSSHLGPAGHLRRTRCSRA